MPPPRADDKWPEEYNEWVEGNRVMALTPGNVERMVRDNEPHFQREPSARNSAKPPDAATIAAAAVFTSLYAPGGAALAVPAAPSAPGGGAPAAPPAAGGGAGSKRAVEPARETVTFEAGESPLLPVALKAVLRDDWEAVVGKRLLHRVPCEPKLSVKGVLDAYVDFCAGAPPPADPVKAQKAAGRKRGGSGGGVGGGAASAAAPAAAGDAGEGGVAAADGAATAAAGASAAPPKKKSHAKGAAELVLIRQSLAALLDFFNRALPISLLYRQERLWGTSWFEWRREQDAEGAARGLGQDTAPLASSQFPAVFLLRMFVALPRQLREDGRLTPEEVEVIEAHAGDFLKWLDKYRGAFFLAGEGYARASAEHAAAVNALLARKSSREKLLSWGTLYDE